MKPNTKKQIITMRWVQFALRLLQLMGAAGLLFCVITLKGVQTAQGWLLRIPVSRPLQHTIPCERD